MIYIRILFLSYYFLPRVNAATWSTYYLCLSLSKKGHKINLIVPNIQYTISIDDREASILEKQIPVTLHRTPLFRMPQKLAYLISPFFLFLKGLRLGKSADVIICQFHPQHFVFVTATTIGKIFQIPVVARANDIYRYMGVERTGFKACMTKIVNTFNESFIKYVNVFLVVCSENKEILLSRLKMDTTNLSIGLSYNGVSLSEFKNVPSKEDARDLLNIDTDKKVITFIGRFSGKEYGIEVLLKALPFILKKEPKTLLIMVGDQLTSHQQRLINTLNIYKNVKIYGAMPHKQIIKFVMAADVCIGPLKPTMAIPQKILEYMICGKPVVTGIKSISKDLNPNSNFLVVPPEPKSVAEAIMKVLQNECYANRLGSYGKRSVGKFTWEKIGADLERIVIQTLKNSRARKRLYNIDYKGVTKNSKKDTLNKILEEKDKEFARERV